MPSATPSRRQRVLRALPGCLAIGSAVLALTAAILFVAFLIGPNKARLEARWERAAGFALAARGPAGLATVPRRRRSKVRGFLWIYELQPTALTIHANGTIPISSPTQVPPTVRLPL